MAPTIKKDTAHQLSDLFTDTVSQGTATPEELAHYKKIAAYAKGEGAQVIETLLRITEPAGHLQKTK